MFKKATAILTLCAFTLGNAALSPAWAAMAQAKRAPARVSIPAFSLTARCAVGPLQVRGPAVPALREIPAASAAPERIREIKTAKDQLDCAVRLNEAAVSGGGGGDAALNLQAAGQQTFDLSRAGRHPPGVLFASALRGAVSGLLKAGRFAKALRPQLPKPHLRESSEAPARGWLSSVFSEAARSVRLSTGFLFLAIPVLAQPPPAYPGSLGAAERAAEFPVGNELFHRLLADPRHTQTSVRYYRLQGLDMADAALGATWGMRRWSLGRDKDLAVQWDVEGMAYSQFQMSGSVNEFQTADYFANLPLEFRRGNRSGRLTLFHESAHLGDDYIRRVNSTGSRYSVEGLRGLLSIEPLAAVRLYGGGTYLLHRIPSVGPAILQGGFELTSPELRLLSRRGEAYLSQDFQSKQQTRWNVDSNTELGFRLGDGGVSRVLRVHVGHFEGHSPFGQFFSHRVSYNNLGASFDF